MQKVNSSLFSVGRLLRPPLRACQVCLHPEGHRQPRNPFARLLHLNMYPSTLSSWHLLRPPLRACQVCLHPRRQRRPRNPWECPLHLSVCCFLLELGLKRDPCSTLCQSRPTSLVSAFGRWPFGRPPSTWDAPSRWHGFCAKTFCKSCMTECGP